VVVAIDGSRVEDTQDTILRLSVLNEKLERQESTYFSTLRPESADYNQKIAVLEKMWVTMLFSPWREDVTTSSSAERSHDSQ
jgi:hypothetical protein